MSTTPVNPHDEPPIQPITPELLAAVTRRGVAEDPNAQRQTPREQLYNEHAVIQVLTADARPKIVTARTRDISVNGIGVTGREEISPDNLVALNFFLDDALYWAYGRVVHSSATIGGYKVGLRFDFRTEDEVRGDLAPGESVANA